jgi:hypothetical protein
MPEKEYLCFVVICVGKPHFLVDHFRISASSSCLRLSVTRARHWWNHFIERASSLGGTQAELHRRSCFGEVGLWFITFLVLEVKRIDFIYNVNTQIWIHTSMLRITAFELQYNLYVTVFLKMPFQTACSNPVSQLRIFPGHLLSPVRYNWTLL